MQVSVATKDSRTYVRRRKGTRTEHDAGIRQRAADVNSSTRDKRKDFILEDDSAKRLINLELDVAEALADFWRMAHEPSQQHNVDVHLCWSRKRTRSSRCYKGLVAPCKPKEEPEDPLSLAKKNRSSCTFGIDSYLSDRDETQSTRTSKESCNCESRAQSPSSPLPSMQLSCGAFLPRSSPAAKSAFRRVLPLVSLQRPYLLPVKSEIEDIQLEAFDIRPQDASVCRKSKSSTLKKESLQEQIIDTGDWKCVARLEELRVKAEVYPVSDLIVLKKPKSALSEKEKEARRLRRIQANRESARQTIRKKQVLSEELMKKVSSLAFENEGMKKKREFLMQELFFLKGQNYHLKRQFEVEASANVGVSAESTLKTSEPGTALVLPAMPSSKEASSAVRVIAQKSSHTFNGVCSAASMGRAGCSTTACTESCTPDSEGAPTISANDPSLTHDLPVESACETFGQANCSLSQPPSFLTYGSKVGLDAMSAMTVAYKSMECFMSPRIAQGVRCGYTYDGITNGYYFHGHSQTHALMGRNYLATKAAAEARRRRKELTRHKFSRS